MRVFAYLQDSDLVEEMIDVIDALPENFEVEYASGESDLLSLIQHHDYDLLFLGIDGARPYPFTTLELLKNRSLKGPVICLHVNSQNNTLFNALSHGAMVALPFTPESFPKNTLEMLLNNAYLTANGVNKNITVGPLTLDLDAKILQVSNQDLVLTAYEYKTLEALLMNVDKVMSRDQILQQVYGYRSEEVETNTVEVFIAKIRKKLNLAQGGLGDRLTTIRGQGYLFTSRELEENSSEIKSERRFSAQLPARPKPPQPRRAASSQPKTPTNMVPVSAWREESTLELSPLKLNTGLEIMAIGEKHIHLAQREFDVLRELFKSYPKPLSVYDLADKLFGDATKISTIYVLLGRLRERIKEGGADEDTVMNISRVGYRIKTDGENTADILAQYKPQKAKPAPKARASFTKQSAPKAEIKLEEFGPWSFNREAKILRYKGIDIPANKAEISFIEQLVAAYPKIASREALARTLYGGKMTSLNTRLSLFRKKLDECGLDEIPFTNVHGVGFKLNLKAADLSEEQRTELATSAPAFRASSAPQPRAQSQEPRAHSHVKPAQEASPKPKRRPKVEASAFKGQGIFTSGALEINPDASQVTFEGEVLEHVTGKNVDILILLTKDHGKAVTYETLAKSVLGDGSKDNQKRIQMGVSSLRHQLNKSVWGLGDQLVPEIGSFAVTLVTGDGDLQAVRSANKDRLQQERAARREAANANGGQTPPKAPQQPAITVNGKPLHSAHKRAVNGGVPSGKKDGPQSASDRFRDRYGNLGLQ